MRIMSAMHKTIVCKVVLLDERVISYSLMRKACGDELYTRVFNDLQLVETDYFGLTFNPRGRADLEVWLDKEKQILTQVGIAVDLTFKLKVKFYTPDPNLLEDELTRYLFTLQVRQDIGQGRLVFSHNTAAQILAHVAQAELGDHMHEETNGHMYLRALRVVPNQSEELERSASLLHHDLRGMSRSDAEFQLLDIARKSEFYGVTLHPATNSLGIGVQLAVMENGIHVYQKSLRMVSYSWAKIRKLSFKRKLFIVKLHASEADPVPAVEFIFSSRDAAKAFWKLAIEHHAFFRCAVVPMTRPKPNPVLSRGSSFRYTGRTQNEVIYHAKHSTLKSRTIDRCLSTKQLSAETSNYGLNRSVTLDYRRNISVESLSGHPYGSSRNSQYSGNYDLQSEVRSPPSTASANPALTKAISGFELGDRKGYLGSRSSVAGSRTLPLLTPPPLPPKLERISLHISVNHLALKEEDIISLSSGSASHSSMQFHAKVSEITKEEPLEGSSYVVEVSVVPKDSINVTPNTSDGNRNLVVSDSSLTGNNQSSDAACTSGAVVSRVSVTPQSFQDCLQQHTPSLEACTPSAKDCLQRHTPSLEACTQSASWRPSSLSGTGGSSNAEVHSDRRNSLEKDSVSAEYPIVTDDVVILSSPEEAICDKEDSGDVLDSLFQPPRRTRCRSIQEEMDELEDLSSLASQVLCYDDMSGSAAEDLTKLAAQVLDFSAESAEPAPLSDLSDLLQQYDLIKTQQTELMKFADPILNPTHNPSPNPIHNPMPNPQSLHDKSLVPKELHQPPHSIIEPAQCEMDKPAVQGTRNSEKKMTEHERLQYLSNMAAMLFNRTFSDEISVESKLGRETKQEKTPTPYTSSRGREVLLQPGRIDDPPLYPTYNQIKTNLSIVPILPLKQSRERLCDVQPKTQTARTKLDAELINGCSNESLPDIVNAQHPHVDDAHVTRILASSSDSDGYSSGKDNSVENIPGSSVLSNPLALDNAIRDAGLSADCNEQERSSDYLKLPC